MIYDGIIQGKSVYLRSAQMEDAEYTYSIRQDPERTKYLHPIVGGIGAQRLWLQKQRETPGDYFFVVFSNDNERIGTYSVYNVNTDTGTGSVGRALLNGNPIENHEAIFLVYDFAFRTLNLQKLYAESVKDNTVSIGINLRLGGKLVGERFDPSLGLVQVQMVIDKADYEAKREYIKNLAEKFANRI